MPLNFPNSPAVNETYTSGSNSWQWDGTVWNAISSGVVVNSYGPTGPTGAFNTTTQTIDFSEDINKIEFNIYTTATGIYTIGEATHYDIEALVGLTATIQTQSESLAVVGMVDSVDWYTTDAVNATSPTGYLTVVMKPPFYNRATPSTTYTAEELLGLTLATFSGGFDEAPPPLYDHLGITGDGIVMLHMEETYVVRGVTGQSWVDIDTYIVCKCLGLTSDDHDAEDAILEGVKFEINNIVAGDGFDIIGHAPEGTYGKYKIKCLGQ